MRTENDVRPPTKGLLYTEDLFRCSVTEVRMVATFVGHWLGGAFRGARDVCDIDLSGADAGVCVLIRLYR